MKTFFSLILSTVLFGCYGNLPPRTCTHEQMNDGVQVEERIERNMSQRVHHTWTTYLDSNTQNWVKHGIELTYFINGQEESAINWKHGKKHGVFNYWHYNGELKGRGTWFEGKLDGEVLEWNEDGVLIAKKTWKQGKLEGWDETYTQDGKLIQKYYWHQGEKLDQAPSALAD